MTTKRILAAFLLLFVGCVAHAADATVAPNGDGQFNSIHDAIMAAPQGLPSAERPWVIHVKPGVYKELIYVQQERRFIKLEGEDANTTIITMNLHANLPGLDGKPIGTFRTPTVQIDGDGFAAENITFENSAGPVGQALALRVDADKVSFKNCRFLGWQDTILTNRGRQYFENCYIAGHVDFIFGAATVWFEKCQIHCLRDGYITAASTPAEHPFGYVFSNCKITGEPNVKTYLGRPWRGFASTIFLNTEISEAVRPEGWHNWTGPEREKTARYSEYKSTGAGANDAARVKWEKQLSDAEAKTITIEKVLGDWNPKAHIKAEAPPAKTNPYDHPLLNGHVKRDIEFAQAGGESLKLDAFVPEGNGPFPAVIFVHGGGWVGGDKMSGNDPLFAPVAQRSVAWFTINYRLAPKHKYPAPVEDIHTAIRWVKAHAAEYKIDPNRIALVGESAGGQLVGQAVVLAKDDTRVAAVVLFYAPIDFILDMERRGGLSPGMRALFGRTETKADEVTLQLLRESSPINHIRAGLPPFLLVHGTGDMSVLYNWSPRFQSKLKAAGVPCDLITIPDAPHAMFRWESFAPEYKDKVADWLAQRLGIKSAEKNKTARTQVFLIGDSTMADKPLADNPERGWGQLLPLYFGDGMVIKNHAVNGRSTKSFIDEGRWEKALQQLRTGDWVFIQFGHNDEKKEDPTRYAAPQTDYKTNLTRFVNEARSKGATPILLTPVMRRRFDAQGKFFDTHGEYPAAVRALATELNVTLIDMHQSSGKLIDSLGVEDSKKLFLHIAPGQYKSLPEGKQDDTHFSESGATQMAGLVVAELRQQKLPLASYLKAQASAQTAEPPREWIDPDTGHRVIRLSREAGTASLYFHQNAYTASGDKLVVTNPKGIATIELKTGKLEQIVEGRASNLVIGKKTRQVFYLKDGTVYATHLDTKATRAMVANPQLRTGSGFAVNADETLLGGSMIAGTATPPPNPVPAGQRGDSYPGKGQMMEERLAARIPMSLYTINIKTGELKTFHPATDWLNHVQFSPIDPSLMMFCHEGPWHKVDRIWTIRTDGSGLRLMHKRTMDMEIAGHEFFSADGKTVWYDLQTPKREVFWLAGVEIATGKQTRYPVPRAQWSVHFNISPDGKLFAGDGGGPSSVAAPGNGQWIYLFTPEAGKLKAEKLVNLSKHNYQLEPNVTFTLDMKWLVFRSNMHGATHVYAVEVKKW